ncbi:MAG: hypothetical protein EOM23_09015, partial [Candidatus Moranbacteria bacterium]|nr:hypothetical protein [Candidatus Moranbacteria bacterium]
MKLNKLCAIVLVFMMMLSTLNACIGNASSELVVHFDSKGGSSVDSRTYNGQNAIVIPPNPTKEGYLFDGWFWDDDFFMVPVTVDSIIEIIDQEVITVYAKWTILKFSLMFDSNGGSPVENIYQDFGSSITEPATPERLGYTFMGWYRDRELLIPYVFNTMPAENVFLYAKWEVDENYVPFGYVKVVFDSLGMDIP